MEKKSNKRAVLKDATIGRFFIFNNKYFYIMVNDGENFKYRFVGEEEIKSKPYHSAIRMFKDYPIYLGD